MNDKELADKVVALIEVSPQVYMEMHEGMDCESFVRDWRVAGALMEKVPEIITIPDHDFACIVGRRNTVYDNSSLSRAIIEACVAALS